MLFLNKNKKPNENIDIKILNNQDLLDIKLEEEIKKNDTEEEELFNDFSDYYDKHKEKINDNSYLNNLFTNFCNEFLPKEYYFKNKINKKIIEDNILEKLGFKNEIFDSINKCQTISGQYLLKNYILNPHTDLDLIQNFQTNIQFFKNNSEPRNNSKFKAYKILNNYKKIENELILLFEIIPEEAKKLYSILYFQNKYLKLLNSKSFLLSIMNAYNIYFVPFSTCISPFYVLITFLFSVFFVYKIKPKDAFRIAKFFYSIIVKNFAKSSFSFLSILSAFFFYIYTYIHSNYLIFKQVKYLYQISKLIKNKIKIIAKLVKLYDEAYMNFYFTPDLNMKNNESKIFINKYKNFYFENLSKDKINLKMGEYLKYFNDFNKDKKIILPFMLSIGLLDIFYSFSKQNISFTSFLTNNKEPYILAQNIYHPGLQNSNKLVKNTIELGGKNPKNLCITGPNASGKSVFMKTIITNIILSQTLGISFSNKFIITPFSFIDSIFNISDNLGKESLFEAQIQRILNYINQINQINHIQSSSNNIRHFSFLVVDEILNSTNVDIGLCVAYSILEYLIQKKENIILSATHYTTLSKLQDKYPKLIKNIMFDANVENNSVKYNYQYKRGVSKQQKLVFNILSEKGMPTKIINDSKNLLKDLNLKNIF